jgi:uncharacterized protein YjiS (DUF1127 family)
MSTTDCGTELDLLDAPRGTASRFAIVMMRTKSVWRALCNRIAANQIYELDDRQLDDIGLTRHDVVKALSDTSPLEDPLILLTRSARQRARTRFQRPPRR